MIRAASSEISLSGSVTGSATFFTPKMLMAPVRSSNSATSSSVVWKCLRAATSMASLTASRITFGSIPFSLLRISMD